MKKLTDEQISLFLYGQVNVNEKSFFRTVPVGGGISREMAEVLVRDLFNHNLVTERETQ